MKQEHTSIENTEATDGQANVVRREYIVSGWLDDLPFQHTVIATSKAAAKRIALEDFDDFEITGISEW